MYGTEKKRPAEKEKEKRKRKKSTGADSGGQEHTVPRKGKKKKSKKEKSILKKCQKKTAAVDQYKFRHIFRMIIRTI